MRKTLIAAFAAASLAVPAGAVAADEPSQENKDNAAELCRALRESAGVENFRSMFGTNESGKNAFGKCVSQKAKKDQKQEETAKANAAKECKAEREADPAAFKEKYGTGEKKSNAYGKCVSQTAKQKKAEADATEEERVTNAAQDCRAEKKADSDAFKEKYGTIANKKNAFGKCVSQKVKEQQQEEETEGGATA